MRIKSILFAVFLATSTSIVSANDFDNGMVAIEKQDYKTALRLFEKIAQQGDASAQLNLGVMYYQGQGVPQDYTEAAKWYRLAAQQGNASAQFNLGVMYSNGRGVPQDYTEAAKWYRLAAQQGNASAQGLLGLMYYQGQGVPQDYTEAAKWYRLAAQQGYANAQSNLGTMYNLGQGVPQDYTEAAKWKRLAAQQDNAKAQFNDDLPWIINPSPPSPPPKKITRRLIVSDEPFMQDGTVEISEMKMGSDIWVLKTEKGVLNGVHYSFDYWNGGGTFSGTPGNTGNSMELKSSNWNVGCYKDPISDKKDCFMKMKNLRVSVYGNGKTFVSIGSNHFPGSSVTVRIDGGVPFTSDSADEGIFSSSTSAEIIEQLKRAKSLTTRYMKWPYRSWVDDSWELYGFNETFKCINWAVKRVK